MTRFGKQVYILNMLLIRSNYNPGRLKTARGTFQST